MCKPQSKSRLRSEWEVLDELGSIITSAIRVCEQPNDKFEKHIVATYLLGIKNLLNELKSSMIERNRR